MEQEIDNRKAFFIILLFAIGGFFVIMLISLNSEYSTQNDNGLFKEIIENTNVKKPIIQQELTEDINIQNFNQKSFNLNSKNFQIINNKGVF